MGSIYRPKYKDRQGIERESSVWWTSYYTHGRQIREGTETADLGDATEKLKQKEGAASKGRITESMERKHQPGTGNNQAGLLSRNSKAYRFRSASHFPTRRRQRKAGLF
jgi:hypothetical protein